MKKIKYLLMVSPLLLLLSSCGGNDVNYSEPKFESYKNEATFETYSDKYTELAQLNKFYSEDFIGSFSSNVIMKTSNSKITTRAEEKILENSKLIVNEASIKYDNNSHVSNIAVTSKQKNSDFQFDYESESTATKIENGTETADTFIQDIEIDGSNVAAKVNQKEKTYNVVSSSKSACSYSFSFAVELMEISYTNLDDYDDISEEDRQYYKYYVDNNVLTIFHEQTKRSDVLSSHTYIVGNKTTTVKNIHQVIINTESIKFISTYSCVSETTYIDDYNGNKKDDIEKNEDKLSFEGYIKLDNVNINKIDISNYSKK